ncbi:follistatin-A-like protein [Dinothrombium tinctorium]|uniref:Follistatin-A-like protein n=1 Tax=Dinothrombium tinctorium TaxID=1965070 RepID=A0A3S3NUX6_9ACAR|nr:follistatin-A-like protein [Dinothrombium tinctorium]
MNSSGRCVSLLKSQVSREECCSDGKATTAFSPEDLRSGELFFFRALRGGVPCQPCKNSCEGVDCGPGKRCVLRHENVPTCVCDSICSRKKRKMGKVCGTDGRTYRHSCRLLKRKCRRDSTLNIAYYGSCQKNCDNIRCPGSKTCIVDQNLTPHCVKCAQTCPPVDERNARLVCGADNNTYPSFCHLRQAACLRGKAVQVAYRGRCDGNASCETIKCPRGRKCLVDELNGGQPRCVTCPLPCAPQPLRPAPVVCASNNRTYENWCAMMQESCALGTVLHVQRAELCQKGIFSRVAPAFRDETKSDARRREARKKGAKFGSES